MNNIIKFQNIESKLLEINFALLKFKHIIKKNKQFTNYYNFINL